MDSVLSRWIQGCPDRETILAIADKMDWSTDAGPMFRQAMEARPLDDEEAEAEPEAEDQSSPESSPEREDDGFRAVSLTKTPEE